MVERRKMRWAEVDWTLCKACRNCSARLACVTRALMRLDVDDVMFVETERCNACGKCLNVCSFKAIRIYDPNQKSE